MKNHLLYIIINHTKIKKSFSQLFLFFASLCSLGANLQAQYGSSSSNPLANLGQGFVSSDSTATLKNVFRGKPGKAMLWGFAIPSAGQYINRQYWKIPIALGAEVFSIKNYIDQKKIFNKYHSQYEYVVSGGKKGQLINPNASIPNSSTALITRNQAKQRSEQALALAIGVHILIALEAFIAGHLKTFDASEDLTQLKETHQYQLHQHQLADYQVNNSITLISIKKHF